MQEQMTTTSVKILSNLFDEFKIAGVKDKLTMRKLVERSIFLYLTDSDFKDKIKNTLDVTLKS